MIALSDKSENGVHAYLKNGNILHYQDYQEVTANIFRIIRVG